MTSPEATTCGEVGPFDRWWTGRLLVPLLAAVLLAPRLLAIWFRGPQVTDVRGFDEGAYFGAAALVAQGRTLYAEVGAAHPPGFYVFAAPFTLLGPPSVSINVVRSVNAIVGVVALLVIAGTVARVTGDRRAYLGALVVGLIPDVARADRMVLVDPLLNLMCALVVAAWWRAVRPSGADPPDGWGPGGSSRFALLAGCALGLALSVKWWAVLLLPAVLITSTPSRRRAELAPFAAGSAGVVGVVATATAIVGGRSAFDQAVLFQVARVETGPPLLQRTESVLGLPFSGLGTRALSFTLLLVLGLVLWRRLRRPERGLGVFGGVWSGCILAAFAVAGSYDYQYNGHLGPAMTLLAGTVVVALARQWATGPSRTRVLSVVAVAALVLLGVNNLRWIRGDAIAAVADTRAIDRSVTTHAGCVFSFEPGWLVPLDRLPDAGPLGPVASEPYVVAWVAAIRGGERGQGAGGPAAVTAVWDRMIRCPVVLVGDRGRTQLGSRWPEFEERYEQVASTYPGGPDVWRARPDGRARPLTPG